MKNILKMTTSPSDKGWKWSQTVRVIDFDFVPVTKVAVEGNFKNLCMTPEMYSYIILVYPQIVF